MSSAYLLLENPKPSNNLGPVLRCAAANGVKKVLAVGYSKCNAAGSHGASKHVEILAFATAAQAVNSLGCGDRSNVLLIGILGGVPVGEGFEFYKQQFPVFNDAESDHANLMLHENTTNPKLVLKGRMSYPISSWPFDDSKINCFALCKSRRGLTPSLAEHCDTFMHIPHGDMGKGFQDSALLDVPSCLSIALHHFSEWAGHSERNFDGHKFELDRSHRSAIDCGVARRQERQEKKQRLLEESKIDDRPSVSSFFDIDGESADY